MDILQKIAQALVQVKAKKPLIHHLTNYVTVNDCANITLAIGASPVMANDIAEVEEMTSCAAGLVINLGALNPGMAASMLAAGKTANRLNIPVVFDPVGVGATRFRMQTAQQIIAAAKPTIIKGNAAEIKALAGQQQGSKGVDSIADESDTKAVALGLSNQLGCIIAVTGKTDVIAFNGNVCSIENGHEMLAGVTGTGCMATSLIASCCAVADDWVGTVAGIAIMGIAGEVAYQWLRPEEGLGAFKMRLFDAVSTLTPAIFTQCARISMDKGGVM